MRVGRPRLAEEDSQPITVRLPTSQLERLTVLTQTVAWDLSGDYDCTKCLDLDPVQLYETAPIVKDPLTEGA